MDITEMRHELRALTDRAEIADLVGRYARSLDERVLDEEWAAAFHTEDVAVEWPVGTLHGRDAVLELVRKAMAFFGPTVHLAAGTVVEVDGDRASTRGALLSTHVLADGTDALFVSAGHLDNELVRTADGWRITRQSLRIAWTQGTPPHPAGTG
ncbi:nuclear transport factor 2 family protein [Streptomyces sp. t39]|uniref:nuclear transport factor 2 family protein n=1 Tax=Streptomyces sp. t39 TaxID=1828156 RepID=UPI0011CD9328|nr:nuclear transport factor 2 family protein [Streptomyces sp. t39]TXS55274.1 nuclear transport factor 2 family protein [Streptomyces sp. t39]